MTRFVEITNAPKGYFLISANIPRGFDGERTFVVAFSFKDPKLLQEALRKASEAEKRVMNLENWEFRKEFPEEVIPLEGGPTKWAEYF